VTHRQPIGESCSPNRSPPPPPDAKAQLAQAAQPECGYSGWDSDYRVHVGWRAWYYPGYGHTHFQIDYWTGSQWGFWFDGWM
jgi:hypothetical protein